jgi:hypothetical protein
MAMGFMVHCFCASAGIFNQDEAKRRGRIG